MSGRLEGREERRSGLQQDETSRPSLQAGRGSRYDRKCDEEEGRDGQRCVSGGFTVGRARWSRRSAWNSSSPPPRRVEPLAEPRFLSLPSFRHLVACPPQAARFSSFRFDTSAQYTPGRATRRI